jgi:hypothetical protein
LHSNFITRSTHLKSIHPDLFGGAVSKLLGTEAIGITKSFSYFGTLGSAFFPHIENASLYSINILTYGAPKLWHICAPEDAHVVENVLAMKMGEKCHHKAEKAVPLKPEELIAAGVKICQVGYIIFKLEIIEGYVDNLQSFNFCCDQCDLFLIIYGIAQLPLSIHLITNILDEPGVSSSHYLSFVQFNQVTQRVGDIVVTAPGSYHYGVNLGFNVAISANTILDLTLWKNSLLHRPSVTWAEKPCTHCGPRYFDCLPVEEMLVKARSLTNDDLFPEAPR